MFASNVIRTDRRGRYVLTALSLLFTPLLSSASGNVRAAPAYTEVGGPIYDTDASGPPYNGIGAAQGNSPVDVGNATQFTLSGLGSGVHMAVTAYDTQGRESWYSNEVSWWRTYLPAVLKR
jgi:hypothetical protein